MPCEEHVYSRPYVFLPSQQCFQKNVGLVPGLLNREKLEKVKMHQLPQMNVTKFDHMKVRGHIQSANLPKPPFLIDVDCSGCGEAPDGVHPQFEAAEQGREQRWYDAVPILCPRPGTSSGRR
jgi:hypothetical protein